jgi:hypothetical protein
MVRKTKEVRKLLLSLRGCYRVHEIREFVKSKIPGVKNSTIYYMLRTLKEEGKVVVYGQKRRTMYCINASRGSKTQRDVDECLDKFLPSFNLGRFRALRIWRHIDDACRTVLSGSHMGADPQAEFPLQVFDICKRKRVRVITK